MKASNMNILALSGGVGGAKLALGLAQVLAGEQLTIIANTADDFEHLGLAISPDLDTVMYTLAGLNNQDLGWGLAGESWHCMQALERLGGETWFRLGDKDLATHLYRSQRLLEGASLSEITQALTQRLAIKPTLLPMCDEPVRTQVKTAAGPLDFQRYFVGEQCRPEVSGFHFTGIEQTTLSTQIAQAIDGADALVVCPSNPFVSVAPILAVNGLKARLLAKPIARVVVSPIVGGMALKGPAAKMMRELAMPVTALAVAEYYRDFATHFVLDSSDSGYAAPIRELGMQVLVTNTVMKTLQDKQALAEAILTFSQQTAE